MDDQEVQLLVGRYWQDACPDSEPAERFGVAEATVIGSGLQTASGSGCATSWWRHEAN